MIVINYKYNNEAVDNSTTGPEKKDPVVRNLAELVRSFNEVFKDNAGFKPMSVEEFRYTWTSHPDEGEGDIASQYEEFSALVDKPIFCTKLAMKFLALCRSLISER